MAKANKKGRNDQESFVKLDRCLLNSAAYRHLEAYAAKLLPLMMNRYHGSNTSEIIMGQREAARKLNCSAPTAAKALNDLESKGFIRKKQRGHFDFKHRHATTWYLTMLSFNNQLATKDFMRWQPPEKKAQPKKLALTAQKYCAETIFETAHS